MAYQNLARRLKFLTQSYRRHGLSHVIEVFRQERIRRSYARTQHQLPSHAALMNAFGHTGNLSSLLDSVHAAADSRLPFASPAPNGHFSEKLRSIQPVEDILRDASFIASGRLPALGICITEPSGVFDWHRDYVSGKTWPAVPYSHIQFMGNDGSDVKYAWEPSRMYWIAWLAKAWYITGDKQWLAEFRRLVDDWRLKNPVDTGVNWAMPMEVAIRSFWLVAGFSFFYPAMADDAEWWGDYLALLWGHGNYLINNLEYFSNLTNHYISNCLGLVAVGSLYSDTTEGKRWRTEGRRRMIQELKRQVLPDGVHYERSLCYHRLVLEMYLIAHSVLERVGTPFPADAIERIGSMAEFLHNYIPPTGTIPQFGDSDDGVILRLRSEQELYNHRDTLALAASVLGKPDLLRGINVPDSPCEGALIITGSLPKTPASADPPLISQLYRDSGFAVLRNEALHVVADIGVIGLHGNNDTLSFTLHGTAGAYIIDPGTYCYTRDEALRNTLRSTAAHNTPIVGGQELAPFDGLWRVKQEISTPVITAWENNTNADTLATSTILETGHHAYRSLGVVVSRRWQLQGAELTVTDRFSGTGKHSVSVRFTVPGNCHISVIDNNTVHIAQNGQPDTLAMQSSHQLAVQEGWYSPSYGVAAKAWWIDVGTEMEPGGEIRYICRLIP